MNSLQQCGVLWAIPSILCQFSLVFRVQRFICCVVINKTLAFIRELQNKNVNLH